MNYTETTFLLTGCASGIGKHLSQVLVEKGAKVYLTDQDEEALECHVNALRAKNPYIRAEMMDVRNAAHWEEVVGRVVSAWGKLDVLMNIAGVSYAQRITEAPIERIDLHIDVNTRGLMYGTRAAALQMVKQRSGHIINFASLAGLSPLPGMSVYCASKFAVRGFSHSVAAELVEQGVYVTTVCPAAVATPMLDHEAAQPDAALSFSSDRVLTVQDIERVIFDRVLPHKPLEVFIPGSMGWLTRFVTAFPGSTRFLLGHFRDKGRRNQARYREEVKSKAGE